MPSNQNPAVHGGSINGMFLPRGGMMVRRAMFNAKSDQDQRRSVESPNLKA